MVLKKSKCGKRHVLPGFAAEEYQSSENLRSECCSGAQDSNSAAQLSGIMSALLAVQSNMLIFNSTIVKLSDQINNLNIGKIEDDQKRRIDELETQNKQLQKKLEEQEIRLSRIEDKSSRLDVEEDRNSESDESTESENEEITEEVQLDIHNLYQWKSMSSCMDAPTNAVLGAQDANGAPIYVGRAKYEYSYLPAKILPKEKTAYVTYAGREIAQHQYEVLCGTGFSWVSSSNGEVPPHAVSCTSSGEKLYIGRGTFAGRTIPGKVHPSHSCLYVGYEGAEVSLTNYEVLVSSASWEKSFIRDTLPDQAVVAGYDKDGATIYVGKSPHSGDMLPANVIPQKNVCYVSFCDKAISRDSYEVLRGTGFTWVQSGFGRVPENAVVGGITSYGEKLYVARALHNGSLIAGKVHPSHGCMFLPYDSLEHRHTEYEVLVLPSTK